MDVTFFVLNSSVTRVSPKSLISTTLTHFKSLWRIFFEQSLFGQYRRVPSSIRDEPQQEHLDGTGISSRTSPSFTSTTPIIFGIISPRLTTITRLPIFTPRELIVFVFTRLALLTVVPLSSTGSKTATGVGKAQETAG